MEACHTVDGKNPAITSSFCKYPIICEVRYIPGGAGFLQSTVLPNGRNREVPTRWAPTTYKRGYGAPINSGKKHKWVTVWGYKPYLKVPIMESYIMEI